MSSQISQPDGESSQVARCRQGDAEALAQLRERCQSPLLGILLARGADRTEADDLLADLWADCVPGQDDRPSILEKFSGKCTLQGWLATVATNRWVDRKRKQSRFVDPGQNASGQTEHDYLVRLEAASYASEDTLIALLRDSLKAALAPGLLARTIPARDSSDARLERIQGQPLPD
jgi:DNA-directed RNA polymerase specialized sigma24 family protein